MRAVVQEVPEHWLEERRRNGWDRFDEVWEGVLHMVPPPNSLHQGIGTQLLAFLYPRLTARRIGIQYETGFYRPGAVLNFRVPDLICFPLDKPGMITERGIEGPAHAVVEILSPDDETHEKFDFYASMGTAEIILIHPQTRAVELYRLAGTRYVATSADTKHRLHAASIDVRFSTLSGPPPVLRIEHGGDSVDI